MTDLILLLQADQDIQAAFERYEDYQEGRGEVFMRQLDVVLTLLRRHPELAPVYAGPYRRMLIRDFPYGVSTRHSRRVSLLPPSWISDKTRKAFGESSSDLGAVRLEWNPGGQALAALVESVIGGAVGIRRP